MTLLSDVSIWIVYTLTVFCKSWLFVYIMYFDCVLYMIYIL